MAKVTSHLEDIASEAIEAAAAYICGILGNALADEAASIAAKWLRPSAADCSEAKAIDKTALLICIRLAFTQARLWELTGDARRYEAPPEFECEATDLASVYQEAADEFTSTGHDITEATQGKQSGHFCVRCTVFHATHNFNKWKTGKPCMPTAKGK